MFRALFFVVTAALFISSHSADVSSPFSILEEPLCTPVVEIPFEPFSIQVCLDTDVAEGDWNSATFKLIPHGEPLSKRMVKGVLYMWDKWNEELEIWQEDGWSMTDMFDKRELISKERLYKRYIFSSEALQICIQAAVHDLNYQFLHDLKVHVDVGFEPILQNDSELHLIARRRHDFRSSKISSSSQTRHVERFRPLQFRLQRSLDFNFPRTNRLENTFEFSLARTNLVPLSSLTFFGARVVSTDQFEVGNGCSFQLSFMLEQPEDSVWKPVLFKWFNSPGDLDPWEKPLHFPDTVRRRQDWTVVLDEAKDHLVLKYLAVLSDKKSLKKSISDCLAGFNNGRNANDMIRVRLMKNPDSDYRLVFRYGGWASPGFKALEQEDVLLSRRR